MESQLPHFGSLNMDPPLLLFLSLFFLLSSRANSAKENRSLVRVIAVVRELLLREQVR
ncbi:hypothetical protein Scep_003957 [Stephania cephalantha]|uniref:Uncharacterized protein n=1 Tax=Stephania cephalantha TaxID=152367 RepID=A0AAP0KT12_9MAGN